MYIGISYHCCSDNRCLTEYIVAIGNSSLHRSLTVVESMDSPVSSQLGTTPTRPQSTRPQDNSAPKTTRPQVNSAPLPTRPQGKLVPSQLGPKFKCKALYIIVYSNFNATKHKIVQLVALCKTQYRPNSRSSTLLLFTCTILQMQ